MILFLLFGVAVGLCAQELKPASATPGVDTAHVVGGTEGSGDGGAPRNVLPSAGSAQPAPLRANSAEGVDWTGLFRASARFLAIEHGFRLLTEPGTRSGLSGSFFKNYGRAVSSLHGWADGDEFYVNYIGHPMQGSVAGFLWAGSDRAYRGAEFGLNRLYWRSRLRAAAFAWAYSEQFEVGPFSEASIGAIQAQFPQQGFVDHAVTPAVGLGWMIGEDVVDRFVVRRIEGATRSPLMRLLSRSVLNPSRSFANVLQGEVPWHRGTREGVLAFAPKRPAAKKNAARDLGAEPRDVDGPAPFEFGLMFNPVRYLGTGGMTCLGGMASAAFRIAEAWQIVASVGGCRMQGLGENFSGDSLTYTAGPRFRSRDWGRWSGDVQLLVGGNKLTEERMFPQKKALLEAGSPSTLDHSEYTQQISTNGFAVSGGGGLNYKLNRALMVRVAELNYQHSWTPPLWSRSFAGALRLSSGVVLRMGTW